MDEKEIDELIQMIEGKMESGVSRLSVNFSEAQEKGVVKERHHLGRCDVGSPWAKGTVSNCDAVDICLEDSDLGTKA
ncbi:MAG: hypothetical protein IKO41_12635 [Lachnospiraceae bacterium]|nr:hypothetical protein [Lachnospiraceae bacterium]MBR6152055.1 hypothetical protein [Lachnospiraceae bacterium]